MNFNYYERHHLHENVYSKHQVDTIKTEITNLVTNLINAKKSHVLVWAEENGPTSDGNLEWSFGNGTDDNISIGISIPTTGKITKATLAAAAQSSPAAEMRVNIVINGTENTNYQIIKQTGNYSM